MQPTLWPTLIQTPWLRRRRKTGAEQQDSGEL